MEVTPLNIPLARKLLAYWTVSDLTKLASCDRDHLLRVQKTREARVLEEVDWRIARHGIPSPWGQEELAP